MLKLRRTKKNVPEVESNQEAVTSNPQGITVKGNALQKIGVMALLTILVPVLLGFTFLILVREPALQEQQVDRVASSFALQQATNIHGLFDRMQSRIQSAALSPLALSAIASNSEDEIALVEKTLLDYFPEVVSLRIIPIGDMGTADFTGGNQGLRNHIEVDLVRRTSEGDKTEPEAYKFEDKWLTSMAARVTHPRIEDHWAVMIITLDNEQISKQMKSMERAPGKFALEQLYSTAGGKKRKDMIAASGSGTVGANTRYADVPDTSWRVSFSPSDTFMSELNINRLPLYTVLTLIVLAALGAIAIVLMRFPKELEAEVDKVISAADQKTSLTLAIPQLVAIAKQLRRATLARPAPE